MKSSSPRPPSLFSSWTRWSTGLRRNDLQPAVVCKNLGTEWKHLRALLQQMTTDNNFNYGSGSSEIYRWGTDRRAGISNPEPWVNEVQPENKRRIPLVSEAWLQNKIHSFKSQQMKTAGIMRGIQEYDTSLFKVWGKQKFFKIAVVTILHFMYCATPYYKTPISSQYLNVQ